MHENCPIGCSRIVIRQLPSIRKIRSEAARPRFVPSVSYPGITETQKGAPRDALSSILWIDAAPRTSESHRWELNPRPLDYESSALPLSYCGGHLAQFPTECPDADSNRDAFRHSLLKTACLPVSPPGPGTADDGFRLSAYGFQQTAREAPASRGRPKADSRKP